MRIAGLLLDIGLKTCFAVQVMNAAADRASILPYIKMFQQLIRYSIVSRTINTPHKPMTS